MARAKGSRCPAVERALDIRHATFYRNYRDLIADYFQPQASAAAPDRAGPARTGEEPQAVTVRRLRAENAEFRQLVQIGRRFLRVRLAVDQAVTQHVRERVQRARVAVCQVEQVPLDIVVAVRAGHPPRIPARARKRKRLPFRETGARSSAGSRRRRGRTRARPRPRLRFELREHAGGDRHRRRPPAVSSSSSARRRCPCSANPGIERDVA